MLKRNDLAYIICDRCNGGKEIKNVIVDKDYGNWYRVHFEDAPTLCVYIKKGELYSHFNEAEKIILSSY